MHNTIEGLLAESLSLGRAGQFVHRYESCQRRLAARVDEFHQAQACLLPSRGPGAGGERIADMTRDNMHGEPFFPGISRTHYLTVFLHAYVAARQFSPDDSAPMIAVDHHSVR